MTGRSGCFAKFAFCIAACRPRLPIPRAYSSAAPRIATWFGRAWRFTAPTRPRGRKTPCGLVDLKGRIIQVRPVNKGETVGYGAAFTAARPSRIAVVAVGYADGFLRSASAARGKPAAEVIIAGKRCPLAGRVSMDLLAVDVTELAEGTVRRGDLAT